MICYHGIADTDEARVVKSCFATAISKPSPLPAEISGIRGMSGQKYRSFINHLVGSTLQPRYLEIGSWAGSTAAAALYGNRVQALCIDNWSQFGGSSAEFFESMNKVVSKDIEFKFIEKDFRTVDYSQLGDVFNIYMFDGPHKEDDQYDGLVLVQAALDIATSSSSTTGIGSKSDSGRCGRCAILNASSCMESSYEPRLTTATRKPRRNKATGTMAILFL